MCFYGKILGAEGFFLNLLVAAAGRLNTGDIIFQLIAFIIVLTIPLGIIIVLFVFKKRNNRLKRVEEKLDKLLSEKENEKS